MEVLTRKLKLKLDKEINIFKEHINNKYGIKIRIFKSGYTIVEEKLSLEELEVLAIELLHSIAPDLKDILSLNHKTRKQEFITIKTIFYEYGFCLKYTKIAMGEFVGNNHASVINLLRKAKNYKETKDPIFLNTYNEYKTLVAEHVETISNTIKSGNNPESMSDSFLN
jgi:hypothetical protein